MEIVSRPEIASADQARSYVTELRAVLRAIGVSDVKMEEGSMRVDANVSVRPAGMTELGTKVEIKNMNSLRSLGRAIDFEIERQTAALDASERIVQETRHWNEEDGRTYSMRTKEGSSDYRYFPEPDLVPVAPTDEQRDGVRAAMPELPARHRARLVAEWGISDDDARILVDNPELTAYAEAAVAALDGGTARDVANWCIGEVLAHLNETNLSIEVVPLAPDGLAELVGLVAAGTLSRNQAKDVLDEALREPKRPKEIVAERGIEQVSDEGELEAIVDQVLTANAQAVAEWREGDDKVKKKKRGFLFGEVMSATNRQGNPQVITSLLETRLASLNPRVTRPRRPGCRRGSLPRSRPTTGRAT
jgi:aspartyl-tRNA(Asn)/glutamyl-tRNA(Gln) amidotransferase subunit B